MKRKGRSKKKKAEEKIEEDKPSIPKVEQPKGISLNELIKKGPPKTPKRSPPNTVKKTTSPNQPSSDEIIIPPLEQITPDKNENEITPDRNENEKNEKEIEISRWVSNIWWFLFLALISIIILLVFSNINGGNICYPVTLDNILTSSQVQSLTPKSQTRLSFLLKMLESSWNDNSISRPIVVLLASSEPQASQLSTLSLNIASSFSSQCSKNPNPLLVNSPTIRSKVEQKHIKDKTDIELGQAVHTAINNEIKNFTWPSTGVILFNRVEILPPPSQNIFYSIADHKDSVHPSSILFLTFSLPDNDLCESCSKKITCECICDKLEKIWNHSSLKSSLPPLMARVCMSYQILLEWV